MQSYAFLMFQHTETLQAKASSFYSNWPFFNSFIVVHVVILLKGVAIMIIISAAVPQQGSLYVTTEFGKMLVAPNEICVIQVSI